MRKFIVLFISLLLLVGAGFFIFKINTNFNTTVEVANGQLTFDYTLIQSLNMPHSETQIITALSELKPIIEGHNFNTKHSYIYIRFSGDNKHTYKVKDVVKSDTSINCIIEKTALPENINIALEEMNKEYIIDVDGNLNKELQVVINIIDPSSETLTENT